MSALVDILSGEGPQDRAFSCLGVPEALQFLNNLSNEGFFFPAWIDNSFSFSPFLVDVESVQAVCIRLCFGPIGVHEKILLALPPSVDQSVVSVFEKPGVRVKGPAIRRESMIRHDDEHCVLI